VRAIQIAGALMATASAPIDEAHTSRFDRAVAAYAGEGENADTRA
jgi:hypothetical protein